VLLPLRLFRNKVANLSMGTQTIQWLILQGSFFAVSVYMQEVNGYNAIQTGLMLTPATIGILAASAGADRVDTGATAVRRRGRGHADLLGQRGPVQLPGRRPGPDLWGCPAESPAKG
jgi:hypothetical protein